MMAQDHRTSDTRTSSAFPAAPLWTEIRPMDPSEASVVARYHQECIPTAFLSKLGAGFLTHLYLAIARSNDGFVLVAIDRQNKVVGFVSGATRVGALYRSVLLRRGWFYAGILLKHLLNLRTLRHILETLFYPAKVSDIYPEAELLSIVVSAESRGSGVATALLDALIAEFRRRGCDQFRVLVRADLQRANAYYVKHGFILAGVTESHGVPSNVYTMDCKLR
jgi:ribosomal protein S18 acetylase RimI-like enzyme